MHVEEFIAAALDQRKVLNAKNIKSIFGEQLALLSRLLFTV